MSADRFYRTAAPTLISFSGGRTSAFMLHECLRVHGGGLPPEWVVAFANTGKEREETLRFVHECGSRWGVAIHWLEWRDGAVSFEEVGFNSASRAGEPFAALIGKKRYLPNAVTRYCTSELKIRVMRDFARTLGWTNWLNMVGLRHDEGHRVLRAMDRNAQGKDPWRTITPLANAKVTRRHVEAFWKAQDFDLELRPYEGNCDLCFLKSRGKLCQVMRDLPGAADWWIEQEGRITMESPKATAAGARFVTEYRYEELRRAVDAQPLLIGDEHLDEHDAECGLYCGGEA